MEAGKHQCGNCRKAFSNEFQLVFHKFKECKAKTTCKNCKTKFNRRRDLLRHENNRKNITCDPLLSYIL